MDRNEKFQLLHEIVMDSDYDADLRVEIDNFITELEESEEE